jgi:hypothetical protein
MSCLAATAEWREKLTYPLAMEFAPQLIWTGMRINVDTYDSFFMDALVPNACDKCASTHTRVKPMVIRV